MDRTSDAPMGEYIYEEHQKLNQWYVWFVLIFAFSVSIGLVIKSIKSFIDGVPGAAAIIVLSALVLFICLFFIISVLGSKLNTIATNDAIHFQWVPLNRRYNKVFWQNVQSIKMIKFNSIGYGMRINAKYGSVYNAFGGYAITILTRGGNKFLIGTAVPSKLEAIIMIQKDIYYFEYENELDKKKNDKSN